MKRKSYLRIGIALSILIIGIVLIQKFYFNKLVDFEGYSIESMSAMQYYIVLSNNGNTFCRDPNGNMYTGRNLKFISMKGEIDTMCMGIGATIIDSYVNDVSNDDLFILVDQKPLDSICEFNDSCGRKKYKDWDDLPHYPIALKALKQSIIHDYWIIEKKNDNIYGPLSKESYFKKKQDLKVPNSLKLKFEN